MHEVHSTQDLKNGTNGTPATVQKTTQNTFLFIGLTKPKTVSGANNINVLPAPATASPQILGVGSDATELNLAEEGDVVTLSATFTDDLTETHTAVVDWGDGSIPTPAIIAQDGDHFAVEATHIYHNGGIYPITLTVTDEFGLVDTASTTAHVTGVGVVNGVLYVIGSPGNDTVEITDLFGVPQVVTNFADDFQPAVIVNDILVELFGGDDTAFVSSAITARVAIDGGDGTDAFSSDASLIVGSAGHVRVAGTEIVGTGFEFLGGVTEIDGSDEADTISLFNDRVVVNGTTVNLSDASDLTIRPGAGDDQVDFFVDGDSAASAPRTMTVVETDGDDTYAFNASNLEIAIQDDAGVDTLDFSQLPSAIEISLLLDGGEPQNIGSANVGLSLTGTFEEVIGTSADDVITGDDADNILIGGDGDDRLSGGFGNDVLDGGAGDDLLQGGWGDDKLFGGAGDDLLEGERGNDILVGNEGDDVLEGSFGRDLLIGGLGDDFAFGGTGDDILIGGSTAYDEEIANLMLLIAEWTSPRTYIERLADLRYGGGEFLAGTGVALSATGDSQTVFDDGVIDELTGNSGQDWFFADKLTDQITDRANNELLDSIFPAGEADVQIFAVGSGPGMASTVKVYRSQSGELVRQFSPYGGFLGGVRVATADVDGDGVADIITGAGPGGGPHVKVYDGVTGAEIRSFMAFDPGFTGGVFVAAADLDRDLRAEIVVGADAGGGPHVRVFLGVDNSELFSFFAYDPGFKGGVRVAAGDITGDGIPDIITAAGPGGGPHVRVFDGATPQLGGLGIDIGGPRGSFYAYDPAFTGGVFVAAGDVNGDSQIDLITGAGAGGGPHVRVIDGGTGSQLAGPIGSFMAYDVGFTGGVQVAFGDVDGDGHPEIITAAGPGGGPHVKVFNGESPDTQPREVRSFFAFNADFTGGIFVAAGTIQESPFSSWQVSDNLDSAQDALPAPGESQLGLIIPDETAAGNDSLVDPAPIADDELVSMEPDHPRLSDPKILDLLFSDEDLLEAVFA